MSFPKSDYKFYVDKNNATVIAVSTYAKKYVKGRAKCDPRDEFDIEKGMALAAARCNERITQKRLARANKKVIEAQKILEEARDYYEKMSNYYNDAVIDVDMAKYDVKKIIENM